MRAFILATIGLGLATSGAHASSSAWHLAEGARLRLLTAGAPNATGALKGALEIDLKPGWKTYWRDPGASGVPPSIDVAKSANVASIDVAYPAPLRVDDETGGWIGYKHSVTFPITFHVAKPGEPALISADVFIGVCEAICVPVQASFSLDPSSDADNADDDAVIKAALSSLPAPAAPGAVALTSAGADFLVVTANAVSDAGADLFLAGSDGYVFGTPKAAIGKDGTTFSIPVPERPAQKPAGPGLAFTLVTAQGAVDGVLPYP